MRRVGREVCGIGAAVLQGWDNLYTRFEAGKGCGEDKGREWRHGSFKLRIFLKMALRSCFLIPLALSCVLSHGNLKELRSVGFFWAAFSDRTKKRRVDF